MGEDLRRAALARDISRRLQLASLDELRVLDRIFERIELGRHRYGPLDIAAPRDWRRELGEELLDAVIYDTIETVRAGDVAHAALQAAAAEELAELERWQANDQKTRVMGPARIALDDANEGGPYEDWEIGAGKA